MRPEAPRILIHHKFYSSLRDFFQCSYVIGFMVILWSATGVHASQNLPPLPDFANGRHSEQAERTEKSKSSDTVEIFEQTEWQMLEKGLFRRSDSRVQDEILDWSSKFRSRFGEKAFETLLTRFMRSQRYRELKVQANALRSQPEAGRMMREIERLSNLIPERHRQWLSAARDTRSERHRAREFSEFLRSNRTDAERLWRELSDLVQRHNGLVREYNTKYMGGVEFYTLTR